MLAWPIWSEAAGKGASVNWTGEVWRYLLWRCKDMDALTAMWVFTFGPFSALAIVPTALRGDLKVAGILLVFAVAAFGIFLAPVLIHRRLLRRVDRPHDPRDSQDTRAAGTHVDPRKVWEKPDFDRQAPWDR